MRWPQVDTNIIVRYLTGDDPKQAAEARALVGHEPVFVPRTVIMEVEWVLRSVNDFQSGQIIAALLALVGLPGVTMENATLAAQAMTWAAAGMDFADALHLASAADCEDFVTFDKRLARAAAHPGAFQSPHRDVRSLGSRAFRIAERDRPKPFLAPAPSLR